MVLVLTGIAVITGSILAFVNHITEEPIKLQKDKTLAEGIKELTYIIYQAQDSNKKDLGAAIESTVGGFGGDLKILVGFDLDGKILGYTILEHAETPGLGAKADKWFQKDGKGCIVGKSPESDVLLVTNDTRKTDNKQGEVDAITASTITSRAFLLAVNNAYEAYKATPVDTNPEVSKECKADNKKESKK